MPANDDPEREPPEPVVDGKWAPWQVTTLVVLFCGAFWFGAYELVTAVFGWH